MKTPLLCLSFCLLAGSLGAEIPKSIPHQGRIAVGGVNFDGAGQFKFLLFADPDANHASGNESALWSNAATSPAGLGEPASVVSIPVVKGLYGTWLGDATIGNMAALPASIEPPAGSRLYLRIWFSNGVSGFQALSPDQTMAAVPFALHAAGVADGAVTAASIADGSIGTAKFADNSVTAAKLASGAVTSNTLADDAVTADKIATGAVTSIGVPGLSGSIAPGTLLTPRDSDQTGLTRPADSAIQGSLVYAVDNLSDRLQIFDVTNPDSIVARDFDQTNLSNPTGIAVSGNFAYVVDSSTTDRLQIFDVSNPDSIVARDFDVTGLSNPTALAVSGNFAYVGDSTTDRLQIFDVSNPDSIVPRDFDQTGMGSPTAIALSGNFAYVLDNGTDRLQLFDVSNPDNIVPRGFIQTGISSPRDIVVAGSLAYVVDAGTVRLQVFDVSDPDNIVARGFQQNGLSNPVSIAVSGGIACVGDSGLDRLQAFDVSDPDNIVPGGFNKTNMLSPVSVNMLNGFAYVLDSQSVRLQIFGLGSGLAAQAAMSVGDLTVSGTLTALDANITGVLRPAAIQIPEGGSLLAPSAGITGTLTAGVVSTPQVSATAVNGTNITAQAFHFSPAKSFTLSIPGNTLIPPSTNSTVTRNVGGYIDTQGNTGGIAPVHLPEGATITGMDVMYFDNTALASFFSINTSLKRVPIITANATDQDVITFNIGSPADPNNTSIIVASSGAPVTGREVVDNSAHTYYVTTSYGTTGSLAPDKLRFYGFRIRYNMSTLNP